jgi:hypothetical protein
MAQLTFPVTAAGLAVPVWIGLDGTTMTALHKAGHPIPAPIQACGLLDTGSNITAVAAWLLQKLAVPSTSMTATQTVGGTVKVKLFKVSLGITDPTQPGPWLMEPDLIVMELPLLVPDVDVLVGLDVLLKCKLLVDGPARSFTLEF